MYAITTENALFMGYGVGAKSRKIFSYSLAKKHLEPSSFVYSNQHNVT